jgi:hypothetical protein
MQRWPGSTWANWLLFRACKMATSGPVSRLRGTPCPATSVIPRLRPDTGSVHALSLCRHLHRREKWRTMRRPQ